MSKLARLVVPLLKWYEKNARVLPWRTEPTPYKVWVSEIMLQQTRVEAGRDYFLRFMKRLPDVWALANVSDEELMKLWEGLGYYNRARNLKKAAGIVVEQYGGEIPGSYEGLLALPGIGPYTAGAVGSIAFGLPVPSVDGNVLRVLSRVLGSRADIGTAATRQAVEGLVAEALRALAGPEPDDDGPGVDSRVLELSGSPAIRPGVDSSTENGFSEAEDEEFNPIPAGRWRPGDLNQALMELGALICIPNGAPKCALCPVVGRCVAFREGSQQELPVKAPKKARTTEKMTVFVLVSGQSILLHKRGEKGLLAGLWELPNTAGSLSEQEAEAYLREQGFRVSSMEALPQAKHIFTHREWHMSAWRAQVEPAEKMEGEAAWSVPATQMAQAAQPATRGSATLEVHEPPAPYSRDSLPKVPEFVWALPEELRTRYPLPSAFSYWLNKKVQEKGQDHANR